MKIEELKDYFDNPEKILAGLVDFMSREISFTHENQLLMIEGVINNAVDIRLKKLQQNILAEKLIPENSIKNILKIEQINSIKKLKTIPDWQFLQTNTIEDLFSFDFQWVIIIFAFKMLFLINQ